MLNREINLLEEYGLHVEKTGRGRGGTIFHCREGIFLLKPYPAGEKRVESLWRVLTDWEGLGWKTDVFLRGREDKIAVMDGYQNIFVLRKWFDGAECDVMCEQEVLAGVTKLVEFQNLVSAYEVPAECSFYPPKTTKEQLMKHTREIKYVYNYVSSKKHKSEFEEKLRSVFDRCYEIGRKAVMSLENTDASKCKYQLCHKDYTHHNILVTNEGMRIVSFDNMMPDCRVSDFAQYLRKVMEKHNWEIALGEKMVASYISEGKLSKQEREDLYARMIYPMRFWKIVNQYSSRRKTGMNLRNQEKLENFLEQEESRQQFLVFLHSLIV